MQKARLDVIGPNWGGNLTSLMLICVISWQNDSLATLLARLEGILGPVPAWMLQQGRYAHRYYTHHGTLFEHSPRTVCPLPSCAMCALPHHNWLPM